MISNRMKDVRKEREGRKEEKRNREIMNGQKLRLECQKEAG